MAGMNKAFIARTIKRIEREKNAIAKARDNLREIVDDAEAVLDSSWDAADDLQRVIDSLSQYL
jgi:ElaB/YqjD/DUF883 family membrane-anchored ribosome-binding protein